ncbi:MAG TPA: hypothetical protein VK772_15225 [Puia sp.]|nr:hypothetical protein [Puia sp.]
MRLTLFFLAAYIPALLCAQEKKRPDVYYEDLRTFKKQVIMFPENTGHIHFANIGFIRVIDARADTAAIGFSQKKFNRAFLVTAPSLRDNAEQLVNDYTSTPSNPSVDTVLMVIRKFWFSDKLDAEGARPRLNDIVDTSVFNSGIVVKIEFYLRKPGGYFPLYRYDSLVGGDSREAMIRTALCASLEKMAAMDADGFATSLRRQQLSWAAIEEFSHRGTALPILTDAARESGVYMTFEEFKNNHPSQKKFSLRRGDLADVLYVEDSTGKEYATRSVWGYCRDKELFIYSAGMFFHLQRICDAFYFYGVKNVNHIEMNMNHNNANPYSPELIVPQVGNEVMMFNTLTQKNYKLVRRPFQLDLESGKIY